MRRCPWLTTSLVLLAALVLAAVPHAHAARLGAVPSLATPPLVCGADHLTADDLPAFGAPRPHVYRSRVKAPRRTCVVLPDRNCTSTVSDPGCRLPAPLPTAAARWLGYRGFPPRGP